MKISFKDYISGELIGKVTSFLQENGACIEQFPQWVQFQNGGVCRFVSAYDDAQELLAFCVVNESGRLFKTALINFGPTVTKKISYYEFLSEIIDHYSGQGYCSITVRLAEPVGSKTEMLSYLLHKSFSVKELYDKDLNWTSLQVLLSSPIDEVVKGFSKGHKSAIKRAQKEGLTVEIATPDTLDCFAKIYCKMYLQRGKELKYSAVKQEFFRFYEFFRQFLLGEIFIVKNKGGDVIGGVMIIFQGKQVRFFKGAADPDNRNLPVLHLGIFEAMCFSKNKGMLAFDLWGYNHLVDDTDQRYHINKFKKGFSDNFVFYAKPIEIILSPAKRQLYNALLQYKKSLAKTN